MTMDRRLFLAALAGLAATPALAQTADPASDAAVAAIQTEVEDIVARFMAAAGDLVAGFATPKVVISFTEQLSWIEEDGSAVHTAAWVQAPPDFQSLFASWLGDAPPMTPDKFFSEVFNAFLVPHEMSHFVDAKRGHLDNGGRLYDGEVHANRVAVAFWLGQPGGEARMQSLMQAVAVVEGNLASPVPEGQDRITYFQDNYAALGGNPPAYGWYQFRMFLDAWDKRAEKDFHTLLAEGA